MKSTETLIGGGSSDIEGHGIAVEGDGIIIEGVGLGIDVRPMGEGWGL